MRNASALRSLLIVGIASFVACRSSAPAAPDVDTHATHASSDRAAVTIRLIAFSPDSLTVPVHTPVTWSQQDAGFHTVTSGTVSTDATGSAKTKADAVFDSGRLANGEMYAFTFDDPGTYAYFCRIHPATMTGRVTAQA